MIRELTPLEALLHDLNADRMALIAQRDALKAENEQLRQALAAAMEQQEPPAEQQPDNT